MHRKNNDEPKASLAEVVDETQALLAATAHATEATIREARNRLRAAMEAAEETCDQVKNKAIQSAKAADRVIRTNPYQTIGIAFGVGALVGFLWSRRSRD